MILKVYWLAGLMLLFTSSLNAQTDLNTSENEESYKRVYVLNIGLGFGCPDIWGDGMSSWSVEKNKNNSGLVSSVQLMTYIPRSSLGYGVSYINLNNRTRHYDGIEEKALLHYVAPQLSFIKRETAFPNGVGYISAGVGYVRYKSNGMILNENGYKTSVSGIGCNVGIAYEYAFCSRMGARLAVDCVYARLNNLYKDNAMYPDKLSILPRKNLNLFFPSLELGLSYYMFQR